MEESHIHQRVAVTRAGDVISGNLDLLSEILLRLPARSLLRFSIVCKLWRSLITSTQFRLRHCRALAYSSVLPPSGIYFYNYLANHPKIVSLPLADNVNRLPPLPTPDLMDVEIDAFKDFQVKVTQSCNGLVMCVASNTKGRVKSGFVYNPAKKEIHDLPSPYDKYYEEVYYNLIFDPSGPPYFKVLCVKRSSYLMDIDVSVYVPGSESWRSCCRFSPPKDMYFDSGVFWNGAIHWIGEHVSMYFDANSEKIGIKAKPPSPGGLYYQMIRYFGEWGGHLHLIQVQSRYAKKFSVLELDKDTWKWSVKYRVHLARLISAFPEMVQKRSGGTQYAFSVLSVIRGESEEDSVLLLTIPGKVVAYNLVHKTSKVVCELPGEIRDTLHFKPISAFQYTENLVPVDKWNVSSE